MICGRRTLQKAVWQTNNTEYIIKPRILLLNFIADTPFTKITHLSANGHATNALRLIITTLSLKINPKSQNPPSSNHQVEIKQKSAVS
jgi:hypothetical protein